MKKRGHFVIQGRVQGVCFRMYACEEAQAHRLGGWVRNRPDGTVEVVVEGDEAAVESFRQWCRQGPAQAKVTEVLTSYSEARGDLTSFEIRF